MRKRNIDKHIWFSRDEAQELQKKAKKACLSEGALIRLLIRGYEPREKPDDRFYDTMRQLSAIATPGRRSSTRFPRRASANLSPS